MLDIECTIKDQNLSTEEAIRLVKEFSKGSAKENLKQVFSSGEDGQPEYIINSLHNLLCNNTIRSLSGLV